MAMMKRGSSLSDVTVTPNWGRIKKASIKSPADDTLLDGTTKVPATKTSK